MAGFHQTARCFETAGCCQILKNEENYESFNKNINAAAAMSCNSDYCAISVLKNDCFNHQRKVEISYEISRFFNLNEISIQFEWRGTRLFNFDKCH